MIQLVPANATHVAEVRIDFSDGGEAESWPVFFGSREQCDSVARMLPAVSYSGNRPVAGATVSVYCLAPQPQVDSHGG